MSFENRIYLDVEGQTILELQKEVLDQDFFIIETITIELKEEFELNKASIKAKIIQSTGKKQEVLEVIGEGVGLIDAYFNGMINNYIKNYISLEQISIVDFHVKADIGHENKLKSDAKVTALLRIKNSQGFEYTFQSKTTSISHSSVLVVQEVLTFFINAEVTYKKLQVALSNAKERGRADLVERFQNQLSTIVKATSYEKIALSPQKI